MRKSNFDFSSDSDQAARQSSCKRQHGPRYRAFCILLSVVLVVALIPASTVAASSEASAAPSQKASTPPLGSGETTYGAPADAKKNPAAEVKPQKKDPKAKRVREIVEDRTETTKTYELSDGERQIVVSAAPLHYKNSKGQFVDISTSLVSADATEAPGTLTTLSTKDKVAFSNNGNGAATITGDGYSLSLSACGAQLSQPLSLGDTAIYPDTGDDTSLSYQALRGGVKETLFLNKYKNKDFYDFRIDFTGLTLKQNLDTSAFELLKSDGTVAYAISDLVVTDSGTENAGQGSLCPNTPWELISSSKTSARFRANLDKTWLTSKDRVWPVKIDPSVTIPATSTQEVLSSAPTSSGGGLMSGCSSIYSGYYRGYISFSTLPNLKGAAFSQISLNVYQTRCWTTAADTVYLGVASSAIPAQVTWNTKPAHTALTSTSVTGGNTWATFDVMTSALINPLVNGTAFNGFVLYGPETTPSVDSWHAFDSPTNVPYITATYSAALQPVGNLTSATTPSTNYFRETDKNGDGIADNKDDYPDAGRGSVDLSWSPDLGADGYHIYAFDGANYRQVGTTLGNGATTWSSAGAGFYPSDTTIAGYGADGTYSGNPFTAGESPSPSTRLSSVNLTYPTGTPFTTGSNGGSNGSGIVVPDGKYIYVKGWANYPGPAKWVRFTQTNYPSTTPVYGEATLQATTAAIPQSLSAFMLNGVLYDGAITASTASSTTIAAYAASDFTNSSATNIGLTFDKPLLNYATGAEVPAGTVGNTVILTTDGTFIYSVAKSGLGFAVRQYSDIGHFISAWTVAVADTTACAYLDGATTDGNNLYLPEWTATNAARFYKVSLTTHQVTDVWKQSDQATKHIVSFSYDATSRRFIGGTLNAGTNVDTFAGPAFDLRDNPSPLYRKQQTTYPNNINYWFRVCSYSATGETAIYSASYATPTLVNRTIAAANAPDIAYTQLGSVAGLDIRAEEAKPAIQISATDFTLDTYGPPVSVQRTYRSDSAVQSTYLPKGWWFSFEEKINTLPSGAAQYIDSTGLVYLFAQDPSNANTYISPAGMFSILTKTTSGWTLTDQDQTQHTFNNAGAITADIDRLGNQVTYANNGSSQVTVTAANGQQLVFTYNTTSKSYTLTYNVGTGSTTFAYSVSGNNLTVDEYTNQVHDVFTEDSSGNITGITRGSDAVAITYSSTALSLQHTGTTLPPQAVQIAYSARSTNVGQAVVTRGSTTAANGYAAGQTKTLYLTDPTGQEIFSSTSADQLYGTTTSYDAYNEVIATRGPVTPNAAGSAFTDSTTDPVGATQALYDSNGHETYSLDKAGLETWNYYNAAGDLIKSIDSARAVTWYSVDSKGQILVTEKLLTASGKRARTEYTYDAQGRTTVEKNAISQNADGTYAFDEKDYSNFAANGSPQTTEEKQVQLGTSLAAQDITTSYVINPAGKTTSTTDGRGVVTQTSTYDLMGNLLTATDKAGMTTTNVYNAFGDQTETYQTASGSTAKTNWTKTSYDAQRNVTSTSTLASDGTVIETTQKTLDVLGREVKSDSNAVQGAASTVFDVAGNTTSTTSEGTVAGTTTTTQYDASGQVVKTTDSLAPDAPTTTTYDAAGNVISTATPGQPTETESYDSEGDVIVQTVGNVTDTNTYDLAGDKVSQTETAPGKPAITTTFTYDLMGRLLSTQMGTQTATINTYNLRGDLLSKTDFDGITTLYTYDAAGNQLTEKVGTDSPTTKTFDNVSRVTQQVNPDGTQVNYTYDGLSRVTEEKHTKGTTVLKDTTTTYDSAGRVSKIADSVSGDTQTYTYQNTGSGTSAQMVTTKTEAFDKNASVKANSQITVTNGSLFGTGTIYCGGTTGMSYQAANTSYDAGGRPTAQSVGTQSSTLSYDTLGRLTTDTNLSAAGQSTYIYGSDSKLATSSYSKLSQSASYTYSADRTQLASATIGPVTKSYTYNSATGDITSAGASSYVYGTAGRLTTADVSSGPIISADGSSVSSSIAKYNYAYDSMGRRTSGAGNYAWSGQTLTSATGTSGIAVSYTYDGSGQRLTKTVGTTKFSYLYDGTKLLTVTEQDGTATPKILAYLYGSGTTPVGGFYEENSNVNGLSVYYFQIISDQRGDVREIRDASGIVVLRYNYDSYGNIISDQVVASSNLIPAAQVQALANIQPLRYAGYAWDAETGLYYCSARYYDPSTASFISRDPAKADGEKSPYLYCGGEPVGSTDQSGLRLTVRSGSRNADVTALQNKLNTMGIRDGNGNKLVEDGIFGPKTAIAVKKFQSTNGLIVDAIVGPNTWSLLDKNVGTFNCYGYAMNTFTWLNVRYISDIASVTNFQNAVLRDRGSAVRPIRTKSTAVYSNEYRVAIRVAYNIDFHLMKQDTQGYGYWSEKHGPSPIKYYNFTINPDSWTFTSYGNNGGIYYNSPTFYLAVKLTRR